MKRLRLIATLVILSICFSLHAEIVSGTCGANGGDNLTWTLNTESGLLKIEGSGEMENYELYGPLPWSSYKTLICQINLPDGLTSLGDNAFYGCTELTSIAIPNTVTNIGNGTFMACTGFTSVIIPNSVTRVGNNAFESCVGLTTISIPNSVTSIGDFAFEGCSGLQSVTIPNSVTNIGDYAFQNCIGLTSITIPNSVTNIGGGAFSGCSGLKDIIIVNDMFVYMPKNYDGTYTIPDNIKKITGGAFYGCTKLTTVHIPTSVTSIGAESFGCSGLTSITIPNSVTSIGDGAFYNCIGLTSITIPNSVTSIGGAAFAACNNLTSIIIPSSITTIADYTFRDCRHLQSVTIPNSVTSIGDFAFYNCDIIKILSINTPIYPMIICEELYIGDDVTTVYDYYNHYCLRKVVLGKKVSQIRAQAFSNANIQEFTITGEEPPYCYPNIFGTQDLSSATLYVPASKAEYYQTTEPWTKFGTVKTLEGDTPVIPTACEKPAIAFENGKLLFTCGTNGAKYHWTITSPDMRNNELNESGVVDLEACYDIYVYATADGFTQSETATAKLYWVKADGVLSGINQVERRGIVVSSDNGFVNVSGLNDGEQATLYSTEGKLLGTQSAQGGACVFATFEKVVIVKIGDSSFKVLVK